jgi:hypothetical protein
MQSIACNLTLSLSFDIPPLLTSLSTTASRSGPTTVLVSSVAFIGLVVMLHVVGKLMK